MSRSIRHTIVKAPVMDRFTGENRNRLSAGLVPWADPYIASLMAKLDRCGGRLLASAEPPPKADPTIKGEAPPPLDTEDPNADSVYFGDDWSERSAWRPD